MLAGDPQQLGPILRSKFTRQYGLQVSLLERLMDTRLYHRDEHKFADHGAYDPLLVSISLLTWNLFYLLRNYESPFNFEEFLFENICFCVYLIIFGGIAPVFSIDMTDFRLSVNILVKLLVEAKFQQ